MWVLVAVGVAPVVLFLVYLYNRLAVARQIYNDAVYSYDTATETVPTNLVAGVLGFRATRYFEIEDRSMREAPQVGLASQTPTGPAG